MRSIRKIISRIIERPPVLFRKMMPGVVFRKENCGRVVFLTFDDGPIPEVTPKVLDILDNYGVKATFFMVGDNVKKYPAVYQEVVERGHKVANHTMHHLNGMKTRTATYREDVFQAGRYIKSGLFRPPRGMMRRGQIRSLKDEYDIILCDIVTRDYSSRLTATDVADNVKRLARNGSIIAFHDSLKSRDKIETALRTSIEWLKAQGYGFETL